MNVGKITSARINSATVTNMDPATTDSKNIQNQITAKQQHLSRLTSDSQLNAQEKEKKRREIQKEIDELNRKLELARMKQEEADKKAASEQQKAKSQKAQRLTEASISTEETSKISSKEATKSTSEASSTEKQPTDNAKAIETDEEKTKHIDMPIEDVQKMLTADYELQKELTQKHVDLQIDSTISVIKSEIRQDQFYETDTSHKEAELETIQAKENFWTEEAQKKLAEKQQTTQAETNKITGMNVQAKINIDMI